MIVIVILLGLSGFRKPFSLGQMLSCMSVLNRFLECSGHALVHLAFCGIISTTSLSGRNGNSHLCKKHVCAVASVFVLEIPRSVSHLEKNGNTYNNDYKDGIYLCFSCFPFYKK